MINIAEISVELLNHCLEKHRPDLLPIANDPDISEYTDDFYNELRGVVADELCCEGFEDDWSANEYGWKLENLIDEIGRLFLYK